MNKNILLRYVLIKKEVEMGNEIAEENKDFYNKMNMVYNNDPEVKKQIDMLVGAKSLRNAYDIISGRKIEEPVKEPVSEVSDIPSGGEAITNNLEKQKVLVLTKKAGFADAIIMALVTGFIGGIATAILFMMIK